tara:strand:+ start:4373 stop:4774 length:402 start_codon:yes stop_codon:yes gene_type:complete
MPGVKLISSICISGILGALIGWLGIFTNRSLGYIWSPEIHLFIYFAFIGFGSGLGAYLPWLDVESKTTKRFFILGIASALGILGAYLGYLYGLNSAVEWLSMRYTIDFKTHRIAILIPVVFMAAIGGYRELKD